MHLDLRLGSRGMSRAIGILLVGVLVLLAIAAVPVWQHWKALSAEIGCMTALKSASDQLSIAYLHSGLTLTIEEGKAAVEKLSLIHI